jgi:hypothetical protein
VIPASARSLASDSSYARAIAAYADKGGAADEDDDGMIDDFASMKGFTGRDFMPAAFAQSGAAATVRPGDFSGVMQSAGGSGGGSSAPLLSPPLSMAMPALARHGHLFAKSPMDLDTMDADGLKRYLAELADAHSKVTSELEATYKTLVGFAERTLQNRSV